MKLKNPLRLNVAYDHASSRIDFPKSRVLIMLASLRRFYTFYIAPVYFEKVKSKPSVVIHPILFS